MATQSSQFPTNFDFGKHWKTKIVPHLDNPSVQAAIRKGVYHFSGRRYKRGTPPASYTSSDAYAMKIMRLKQNLIEKMRKENKLPAKYFELKEMEDDDEVEEMFFEARNKILDPHFTWDKICNNLESYVLFHGCHSWAPTFELTLARLVEPEEKWIVMSSKKHSTVVNKSGTKCFDLLYWQIDGRLENYLFGDPITADDETLGGKQAWLDARR
jgi:hypothetical protein